MINFEEIESNEIEEYGVKWRLHAILGTDEDDEDDDEECIDVFLYADHPFER